MFTGVESAVLANVTGGIVSFAASKYLDKYYPNVGGKPENLGKEEKDMSDHESFRVMVRTATRETLSRTIGLVITQLISEELKYTDPLSCFYRIGREEGPAGFFTVGSGLAVSMLPYAPTFSIWQDAWHYLQPHGLS
ncbi:hypothetical protein QR680_004587 [Steinernema hermaphroditum]|uniref:Uncharacterized protein n=1 Tax=Steinernema hermaphroditum TaxID=289476 RepID=A0AA39HRE1_9BILA|nr:hypothetical protein QR680_004587 [Steinernema hermaphroditum]